MTKIDDLTGRRFGRLIVTEFAYTKPRVGTFWLCKCDCGTEKVIRRGPLVSGRTISCGCAMRENRLRQMTRIFGYKTREENGR